MKTHLFWVACLLLTACGGGQRAIIGKVVDEDGQPIKGVTVTTKPETDPVLSTTKGVFNINQVLSDDGEARPLPEGKYLVKISMCGFKSIEREVELSGEPVQLGVQTLERQEMDITDTAPTKTKETGIKPGDTSGGATVGQ